MRTEPGPRLAVQPLRVADVPRAAELAEVLGLPLLAVMADTSGYDVRLQVQGSALALRGDDRTGPVSVDFGSATMRHRRRAGHNELLGRAVGVGKLPGLTVLDATAGLGRDSFVLADLGCTVHLCERHPVLFQLLLAGLGVARSSSDPWLTEVADRMVLCPGDAMNCVDAAVDSDVIYLDPMFPAKSGGAAVKKEMALFQRLLGEDADDASALLAWALQQPVARVVVKRPVKAPALGGLQASHSIRGKAVRFDVHVLRALVR